MDRRILLPLFLSLGSFCQAQDATIAAAPASTPIPAPIGAHAITGAVAGLISASANVPPVCVRDIMDHPEDSLGFNADPFCAAYLALSSNQYKAFQKKNRDAFGMALLSDPGIQAAAIQAVKSLSQQTGSSTGTGGSTNLTAKGLASQFLSLASEYGALTESTSGQVTTLSGTLAGIPLALLKNGLIQSCPTNLYGFNNTNPVCTSPRLIENLSRISYSVGVNSSTANQPQSATVSSTATASAVPATFLNNGSDLKVTAVTAKWIALQGKPSSAALAAGYDQLIKTGDPAAAHSSVMIIQLAEDNHRAEFTGKRSETLRKMNDALGNQGSPYSKEVTANVVAIWKAYATDLVASLGIPDTPNPPDAAGEKLLSEIQKFALSYAQTIGQEQAIGLALARPAILTFEYENNRPLYQPSNSVFRVIYQAKLGQVTLTANGAASIYDSTPSSSIPGSERLRDVQIAAQADLPLSLTLAGKKLDMTGSGSFYFQNQTSPSILNVVPGMPVSGVSFTGLPSTATQVFAQKGNIAIGQAKLTLGSGSNLKVPISVTYSNRTELVTSPVWRGQIGISYDFDSLFTKR